MYKRKCVLCSVSGNKVELSEYGKVVRKCWKEIPDHYDNVSLDEFVIMPNHIHGVIIVDQSVGDADLRPLQRVDRSKMLIPKVLQQFKSSATRKINKNYPNNKFKWQRSYYDHVIRNEKSLNKIRKYIKNNVYTWETDLENPVYLKKLSNKEYNEKKRKLESKLFK